MQGKYQFQGFVRNEGGHGSMPAIDHTSVPAQLAKLTAQLVDYPPKPVLLESMQVFFERCSRAQPNVPMAALMANVRHP